MSRNGADIIKEAGTPLVNDLKPTGTTPDASETPRKKGTRKKSTRKARGKATRKIPREPGVAPVDLTSSNNLVAGPFTFTVRSQTIAPETDAAENESVYRMQDLLIRLAGSHMRLYCIFESHKLGFRIPSDCELRYGAQMAPPILADIKALAPPEAQADWGRLEAEKERLTQEMCRLSRGLTFVQRGHVVLLVFDSTDSTAKYRREILAAVTASRAQGRISGCRQNPVPQPMTGAVMSAAA